ncbi:MAG: hypothetical protein ABI167_08505 [Nitrosospira sp.]
MKYFSMLASKATQSMLLAASLTFCVAGIVQGQSHNPEGGSAREPAATNYGSGNKPASTGKEKAGKEKRSKQESSKKQDAENYRGAQPPQGGRVGQGPEHATENGGN